jgi:hypothetical protein
MAAAARFSRATILARLLFFEGLAISLTNFMESSGFEDWKKPSLAFFASLVKSRRKAMSSSLNDSSIRPEYVAPLGSFVVHSMPAHSLLAENAARTTLPVLCAGIARDCNSCAVAKEAIMGPQSVQGVHINGPPWHKQATGRICRWKALPPGINYSFSLSVDSLQGNSLVYYFRVDKARPGSAGFLSPQKEMREKDNAHQP